MKLPNSSSRYKGVVMQHSGKWGAQIYSHNKRIWLGTFCTQVEAAQTYDLASWCLNGTHAVTNFNLFSKSDQDTEAELEFLRSHTKRDILRMLRSHTYHEELKRSRKMYRIQHNRCNINAGMEKETRELLFFKLITRTDVGPQNRLLIARKHDQKYLPLFGSSSSSSSNSASAIKRGLMINFEDRMGKIWKFRYTYWRSGGIHVLNGGWAKFARENNLKPGDVIQVWRVTNEFGEVHLFIECHTERTATAPSPAPLYLPELLRQPSNDKIKIIRLFGVNISASHDNN